MVSWGNYEVASRKTDYDDVLKEKSEHELSYRQPLNNL